MRSRSNFCHVTSHASKSDASTHADSLSSSLRRSLSSAEYLSNLASSVGTSVCEETIQTMNAINLTHVDGLAQIAI